jgi:hypothetical protein
MPVASSTHMLCNAALPLGSSSCSSS